MKARDLPRRSPRAGRPSPRPAHLGEGRRVWEEPCPGHIQPTYKVLRKEETTPILGFPVHGLAPWLRLGETTAPSWKERQWL